MFFYLNYMGEKVYISEEEYYARQKSKVSSPGLEQDLWIIMNEEGMEIEVSYEEYLKWEQEQKLKKQRLLEEQQIVVEDLKAYFYMDENGNKVPLTKEQYKQMKAQEGMKTQKTTSFHNKATIRRNTINMESEEVKKASGSAQMSAAMSASAHTQQYAAGATSQTTDG